MARARNLKPRFFTDAELVECPCWVRLLFAGLWTLADREGRLVDRPKQIGMDLFPRDDFDVEAGLRELAERRLIVRYEAAGGGYIWVKNFGKHQNPHKAEAASRLPPPPSPGVRTVQAPGEHGARPADSGLPQPDSGFPEAPPPGEGAGAPAREEPSAPAMPVLVGEGGRDVPPPSPPGGQPRRGQPAPKPPREDAPLPVGWQPDDDLLAWAAAKGWPPQWVADQTELFVGYWTQERPRERKRSWGQAWQRWLTTESAKHRPAARASPAGARASPAVARANGRDKDWLGT